MLDTVRRSNLVANNITADIWLRSTNGSSAAITLTYSELLWYYTFCRIEQAKVAFGPANSYVRTNSFVERSGQPCMPQTPGAHYVIVGPNLNDLPVLSGTVPRYYSGASLYVAWLSNTYAHSTTDTTAITATHAPLYRTLRGSF